MKITANGIHFAIWNGEIIEPISGKTFSILDKDGYYSGRKYVRNAANINDEFWLKVFLLNGNVTKCDEAFNKLGITIDYRELD